MKMPLCARCKRNMAVIFISRLENGKYKNEGLCLKCAHELGIKPVGDMMEKLGITDENIDQVSEELTQGSEEMLESLMNMVNLAQTEQDENEENELEENDEENPSRAPAMPFFNFLNRERREAPNEEKAPRKPPRKEDKKRKFLRSYALSLTERAEQGQVGSRCRPRARDRACYPDFKPPAKKQPP